MVMTDDHNIYNRNILDVAWHFGNPFWSHELHRAASLGEYWIKQGTETTREFDIETSMAEPCCSKFFGLGGTSWWKLRSHNGWCSVFYRTAVVTPTIFSVKAGTVGDFRECPLFGIDRVWERIPGEILDTLDGCWCPPTTENQIGARSERLDFKPLRILEEKEKEKGTKIHHEYVGRVKRINKATCDN